MSQKNTGFDGDDFGGQKYYGLYEGKVVDRDDPDGDGRVRVQIPGLIDERSAWARPKGGGSKHWGFVRVPPLDADVLVQFVNGDIDRPVYEPYDYGTKNGEREMFPEHEDPDVIVGGFGPFRVVVDLREDEAAGLVPSLTIKQVAINTKGQETDSAWVQITENSVQVYGDSAVEVGSGAITNIDSGGDVQVKGRKLMPTSRPVA